MQPHAIRRRLLVVPISPQTNIRWGLMQSTDLAGCRFTTAETQRRKILADLDFHLLEFPGKRVVLPFAISRIDCRTGIGAGVCGVV